MHLLFLVLEIEGTNTFNDSDELFEEAVKKVKLNGWASASLLQRALNIGYTRATRLVDQLDMAGIVSPVRWYIKT